MLWRTLPIVLVALMATGGNASAASVGSILAYAGTSCAPVTSGYSFTRTFDVEILPGTRVLVAGNPPGTSQLWVTGTVHLRVESNLPMGTAYQATIAYPYYSTACTPQWFAPMDITSAFGGAAGITTPVTLSVTMTFAAWNCGGGCGATGWYWGSSPIHVVGIGGVAGTGVASLQA